MKINGGTLDLNPTFIFFTFSAEAQKTIQQIGQLYVKFISEF